MLILNRTPMAPLARLHDEINDLFNAVLGEPTRMTTAAIPPMNVWEEPDTYRIEAELPGFTMKDVQVSVTGNEITITGERTVDQKNEGAYLRRERGYGSFTRTWTLPTDIDADRVEASLRDGVLLLTLPKSPKALPRKIEVKTSTR